jgi:murein L,D-transpeptidase YafK
MRSLFACAAVAAAIALAGCNADSTSGLNGRHMQPLSDRMLADLESRKMGKESPILVRIFKEESELEVWKEDKTGRFALLRTYPICRWSGELGPKIKQGDRQAPEGFYTVTPAQMNPNSQYYLAINTGFPNTYDRANDRTGAALMIHGDCASAGCYAMTDEQIAEIYALAREAFLGGQKSFQVQAYPFRMTANNLARHRNSPHMTFWRVLKHGYDHFEVTRLEPKVDVCEKQYVFNAESRGKFVSTEKCPAYSVPQQIASAVRAKQQRDDSQVAQLVARGLPATAASTTGQGGMNAAFLAAVRANGGPGSDIRTGSGTIPGHVRPPAESSPGLGIGNLLSFAAPEPKPAQVASASTTGGGLLSLFGLTSKRESESAEPRVKAAPPTRSEQAAPSAKREQSASPASTSSTGEANGPDGKRMATTKVQASNPQKIANAESESKPASTSNLLSGAAPTVPTGGFSR